MFPDNSGHYIENTGTKDLMWVEVFKDYRIMDVSLSQWLDLTPSDVVTDILKVSPEFVTTLQKFKGEKKFLV